MRRWRWGVLLGSAAFHALLVVLFVLDLNRGPVAAPQPPMTVWLERPQLQPLVAKPSLSRGGARAASPTAAPVSPIVASDVPATPSPEVPVAPAQAPAPDLSGLGGCRLATLDRLSPEARARCQERLARAAGETRAPRLNLDPNGRYARDATPYLTRPPKNGCKPVGSVKQEPWGQTSATLGIGCAWSF